MVDINGPLASEKRGIFFKLVLGQNTGYLCLAFITYKPDKTGTRQKIFREEFYKYPEDLNLALVSIEGAAGETDVYFCPQLLREKKRTKENVGITPNVWADLDTCPPSRLMVQPSLIVQSSPDKYQAYWVLDGKYPTDDVEEVARRIAYEHAKDGADRSGWDLTQLLRVPNTPNFKYLRIGIPTPTVTVQEANRNRYCLEDFDAYPATPDYVKVSRPMPPLEAVQGKADEILLEHRGDLNPLVFTLYGETPAAVQSWSELLWRLLMMLFEADLTSHEVFAVAMEAKCNKWARDGAPLERLWHDVCRAEARARERQKLLVPEPEDVLALLTQEERTRVEEAPETFIERYQEWAQKLGDAAPQYHQAGAFVALSSVLAGSVRLPTSYGTVIPNLWFMILADTTLTRKTTAMDIAMDLITDVDDDIVMATDGSLEGLLTSLAARAGRPSIFLRDEFSGLLEQMAKKDYMAGMPELLTKLYDGKMQKRVLRKEVMEVRDPRLILFAGGIKSKITQLLTFEMVSSGFIPRFILITAESDLNRVKPIGPPTHRTTGDRDRILKELQEVYEHYHRTTVLHIQKLQTSIEQKFTWDAEMSDDAWVRYNALEGQLLDMGLQSRRPEIMTPVGDRLAKSVLKAALLIAAARQRTDTVVVSELDILRAIKYGEQWFAHCKEIMANIGKGTTERMLDSILRSVLRAPEGVPRSTIMQNFHLSARDASQIFQTLDQRGLIVIRKSGRTEMIMGTALARAEVKMEEKRERVSL